jgi:GNAT superfamily N-acetyltransferase
VHPLARRLELSEAKNSAEFAHIWQKTHPDARDAVMEVAGGIAAFGGPGSPLSHAVGLGMSGQVTAADMDRLEAFYVDRGAAPTVDLCPLAHPSLSDCLAQRGYRITEYNNVLVRPLTPEYVYENPDVRIADSQDQWARTVSEGFFERAEFTNEELELASIICGNPAGTPWIALAEGEPAAAAGMAIQDKLALLMGDSTIARFRNRGLHRALIQARLAYAAAQGCDLATASTVPLTASQSNYERLGFRVLYTKMITTRE